MGPSKTITFKGCVKIHDDEATKSWFYPEFAAATQNPAMDVDTFVKFLDTPELYEKYQEALQSEALNLLGNCPCSAQSSDVLSSAAQI